jgi:hypothetical protein
MSFSTCPTCFNTVDWSWEEAFDKFGFGDGDGLVMTEHVADVLRGHGYAVTVEAWGLHNVTIASIKTKNDREVIPFDTIRFGYDDARGYLPKRIIKLLDAAFPDGEEVEP